MICDTHYDWNLEGRGRGTGSNVITKARVTGSNMITKALDQ